ncbi:hypothetical protein [Aneurinibacillus migulanus]|uniref:Uncharacterized protein n=1 Tax=Aneurinibacillus migulanus TaxID=47500 RepID=A0A0D1WNP8_ANEMI|nr:hypothetical protein [Aneurinibacillus migulanus]KIV60315.1 hypothetical protein TS65_00620 [Aneurinibacillus migulanus]KON90485.1 hypothetical protein AF333_28795 [Aneurinibacillus migulanus]MED0894944.1 hypothetical protein [Aneurinibacillus migulanus]MED1614413.1 hypothetical protein [Aneurinibacillus migulanus]SDJ78499.1 hypothetical protein SAMN04487909_12875 [Aneurinibacillus migulanus]
MSQKTNQGWIKRFKVGKRTVKVERRADDAPMGRFGGGWEYCFGIQMGKKKWRGTIYLMLWRFEVRIDKRRG